MNDVMMEKENVSEFSKNQAANQQNNANTTLQNHRPLALGRSFTTNTKKLVPFTEIEWKYVQKTVMSEQLKDLEQMSDLMSMWISRMQHDTPVIIGISELVLRALVLDRKNQNQHDVKSSVDSADAGLIYGSVIIRFVNYVNEVCQPDDGQGLLSIANAVGRMGIPSWIVDIRHQATHGQMPPVNLMMEAIKFCRKWLWKKHWSRPFNEAIKETLPREAIEQKRAEQKSTTVQRMVNIVCRFREWRKMHPNLDQFHSVESQPQWKIRTQIEHLLESSPDEFVTFFATVCLALPPVNSDADSVINEDDENEVEIFARLENDVMSREKFVDVVRSPEQMFYRPVLELLHSKECLPRLFAELVRIVSIGEIEVEMAKRIHLAGWVEPMFDAYLKVPEIVSTQQWRNILKNVVLAPQFFRDENITRLLCMLSENGGISDRCRRRLERLLKISHLVTEHPPNSANLLETSMYSVKSLCDLQHRIRKEEQADSTFMRDPLTMEDAWSLAQPDELGPLGLTADQHADTLCLVLCCDDLLCC